MHEAMEFLYKKISAFVLKFRFETTLFIIAVLLLFQICYQKYKKRLLLPPGPIGLPFVGYLPFMGKYPHVTLAHMKKKYGDFFGLQLGPTYTVVIDNFELMKDIFNNSLVLKRPLHLFDPVPTVGFNMLNGEEWKSQRKFSMFAIKNLGLGKQYWEDRLKENVEELIQTFKNISGKPVNIKPKIILTILHSLSPMLFGRKVEKNSVEEAKILHFVEEIFSISGVTVTSTLLPFIRKSQLLFKKSRYSKVITTIKYIVNLVQSEIGNHKKQINSYDNENFIDAYLEEMKSKAQQDGTHFTDFNLQGNATILLLATIDTSSNSLEWLFRLIATYPDIQKKVQNELDDFLNNGGSISYAEKSKIPYTFATVLEFLRIGSLVPLSTRRKLDFDMNIRNYTLPKGTELTANLWSMNHDPTFWEEPEIFKPERFLTEDGKLNKNRKNFATFSVGKRNCPGEFIAYMTIFIIFASLMQKFTVSIPTGVKPDFDIVNGLVMHLKPQPICFEKR